MSHEKKEDVSGIAGPRSDQSDHVLAFSVIRLPGLRIVNSPAVGRQVRPMLSLLRNGAGTAGWRG